MAVVAFATMRKCQCKNERKAAAGRRGQTGDGLMVVQSAVCWEGQAAQGRWGVRKTRRLGTSKKQEHQNG